jgi:cell division septal protein FtsQ
MFWSKKKNKRIELELRAPRKRRSFFEKKEKKMPNPVFSRMIFRLLFLVFVGATAYILFFSPFLEIKKISLEGVAELEYEDVYNKVSESFSGKYFYFIPKNNLILISRNRMRKELSDSFKKISKVEIEKIFPDGIAVKIVERKALLVWCSAGPCYIIDENGYAYTWTDFESDEVKQNNLLNIVDNSGKPVAIGEKVLDEEYMEFVMALEDKLNGETGIKINNKYHVGSRIAEEVRVRVEEGWEIFFSTSLPMENSIQTFKTFLEKEMTNKDKSKLEYIDLRAENKVYYKFRDEEKDENKEQENTENNTEQKDNKKKD